MYKVIQCVTESLSIASSLTFRANMPQALHGKYELAAKCWIDAIDGLCSALVSETV